MGKYGDDRKCDNCLFFLKTYEDRHGIYGECRRFPPVLSPLDSQAALEWEHDANDVRYEHSFVHWVHPAVTNEDWCGEWESFPETPKSRV